MLANPLEVESHGKTYRQTTGMCSCCGFSCGPIPSDTGLFVVAAGVVDSDGVCYARLCTSHWGDGCLHDVLAEKRQPSELDGLRELYGDDIDAFVEDVENAPLGWDRVEGD